MDKKDSPEIKILDKGSIRLVDYMGDDNTIVSVARVSHLGKSKGIEQDEKLINYLMEHRHTSPFEHVVFQFLVEAPLFVRNQWFRHRTWSYNEVSRRYTSEDIKFYIPECMRSQSFVNRQASGECLDEQTSSILENTILQHSIKSMELYKLLIAAGVAREQARIILPVNLYTKFYATVDLHNLFNFLELRNSEDAQFEIRLYAQAIEKIIEPIVPVAYKAWKKYRKEKR